MTATLMIGRHREVIDPPSVPVIADHDGGDEGFRVGLEHTNQKEVIVQCQRVMAHL